jgi:hypothetical protein
MTTPPVARSQPMRRPTFDRALPPLGYSLARWRHRKDQAELNSQLWMSVLAADLKVPQLHGSAQVQLSTYLRIHVVR